MGAATALLVKHPRILGKVVDSPYTSIPDIVTAIARRERVPAFLCPMALFFLKHRIVGKADFDLSRVSPLESAKTQPNVPARFCHAKDDEFIPIAQGEAVFMAYSSADKKFRLLDGGHNGRRSLEWIGEGCLFALRILGANVERYDPVRFVGMADADAHFQSSEDLIQFMANHGTADTNVDSPVLQNQSAPE
jgi:hypothetical protein